MEGGMRATLLLSSDAEGGASGTAMGLWGVALREAMMAAYDGRDQGKSAAALECCCWGEGGEWEGEGGKGVGEGEKGRAATAASDRRPSVASTAAPHGRSSSLLLQQTGSLESIPEVSGGETSGVDVHAKSDPLSELGEREVEKCCRLSIEDTSESTGESLKRALTTYSIEPWLDQGLDDEEEEASQQPPKATPTPARVLPPTRRTKEDNTIHYKSYPREIKTWWNRMRRVLSVGFASCGGRMPPRSRLPTATVRQEVQTTDRCPHLAKTPW
ncbi:unnamed protein product [Vitrella brassicaformis CCMP3155]|uniref:Uncharacterized protein n=1 Tax=Vitrella brassicaformis (strain CCMP3155) TaxID=1169540 RepID=A0A0G4H736_VITBC|nr:unnamed protein product [Vitrella brassicaformis CCMP3155]|eukprot:CEM39522.1 unnamed protein product [Vitrella brassicaformis CCMP3155]